MRRALQFPAGRRSKFVVLVAWLLIFAVAGAFAGKFESAQKNEPSSFLPGSAESVKALAKADEFPSGEATPAVVVYRRDGGLRARDRARIDADRAALNARPPVGVKPIGPATLSRDGTSALLVAPVVAKGESDRLLDAVDGIRARVHRPGDPGLRAEVTGPAGFSADAVKVFGQINGTLLLATAALIFVLLILIYRSPVFWAIPLFSVICAEVATRALGYGIATAGVTVNGQSAGILAVLVFGAGTDYALLLVARYREELRKHEDKHEAMVLALGRAGPTILASGFTVIAGLLCLSLAEVNGTAGLGPIGAMGVAMAMFAMLTILPALLLVAGRRAFWPFVPRFGGSGADEMHGPWRRLGERVAGRPRRVWLGALAVLAVLALGLVDLNSDLTSGNAFRNDVEAKQGQRLLARGFPAGANAPTNVTVADPARLPAVRAAVASVPGVARLGPAERSAAGARFDVTLSADPYSDRGFARIPAIRSAAKAAGGASTLVGGPTAEERDLRVAATRDNRVIIPLVTLAVFLILCLLLRAVTAPLLLIATVIASFGASLGVTAFLSKHLFGFQGLDPGLPLFAFIFLVALGVDYNIFLMARVREETLGHGTRRGMVRGLAVTGAVITSAGVVLAGTFSTLAVLPLVALTQIGFVIAFGVLLDTLLVRSVLVPALVFDLGGRIWWPSQLAGSREQSAEDEAAAELRLAEEPARA